MGHGAAHDHEDGHGFAGGAREAENDRAEEGRSAELSISRQLCHHVAPRAMVPSIWARGTLFSTSRLMAVMIGIIMIPQEMMPATKNIPAGEVDGNPLAVDTGIADPAEAGM